jgi:ParB-like chromosome segregation protein Spo0J
MMSEKTRTPPGGHQKSLADYDAEGRAVRANMEKLRALRLAKEAAEAASAPPKVVKKAAAPKKKKAEPPAKLSDWLANQQKGGFRT